ncbi:hypothetical protein HanRHA438_Chr09g0424491 [Helianthus annuus]|nr:hypothetical protein HanRHA438_Chr09g0424491 [Helianthus annuus]
MSREITFQNNGLGYAIVDLSELTSETCLSRFKLNQKVAKRVVGNGSKQLSFKYIPVQVVMNTFFYKIITI